MKKKMSAPKCRRVKRPTTLAKRSHSANKNFSNKRSYKPLYEKLKVNNNALAKALSEEKQETQYLFSQNLSLMSEVQDLGVACNRRDDIISGVLKDAKDTVALIVTLTNHVTNMIVSCEQVCNTARFTPRKSTTTNERRESNRRLSLKSPARGVVQPMVSGHTITRPTINLSRLNIQREYRIQEPPNLSDIDEGSATTEQSPSSAQSINPVRMPITRPMNCVLRRIDRMPERLQHTLRTSDENERRSSINRNTDRISSRLSLRETDVTRSELRDDERLRSPRVSLHDVSRLLQNSQSVNIRTLLDNSSEMESEQSENYQNLEPENASTVNSSDQPLEVTTIVENMENERLLSSTTSNTSSSVDVKKKKQNSPSTNENDDPLEGPSWLLNDTQVANTFENSLANNVNFSRGREKVNKKRVNFDDTKISPADDNNVGNSPLSDVNDDDVNDDTTTDISNRWVNEPHFYRHFNNDDERTDTNIFVTRKRGSNCDDTDDFTLMWRGRTRTNHGINDFVLPVLESPIVKPPEVEIFEPEPTDNIQLLNTQNFSRLTPVCPRIDDDTIDNNDDDDVSDNHDDTTCKKRVYTMDSSNDCDWTPTPKRKNVKEKKDKRAKDPSSAKVVLQKLRDDRTSKGSVSSEGRLSRDNDNNLHRAGTSYPEALSDSEISSNASSTKQTFSSDSRERPKRLKAPTNMKEPSLSRKLRRN